MNRLTPLLVFAGLCVVLVVGLVFDTKTVKSALIGRPAPSFKSQNLLDQTKFVSLEKYRGHVVVFNIWASWCPTCYQEHPYLMEMAKNRKIRLIGLNYKDNITLAKEMLMKNGNPYAAIAYDPEGIVGIKYGFSAAPETFIIDKKGVIRYKHIGAITYSDWKNKISEMIEMLDKEDGAK